MPDVTTSNADMPSSVPVAIVGAGLSGLMAARRLRENGISALVLDKSRGVGGRCATRRIEGVRFDHGAQFFTTRDPFFGDVAEGWVKGGIARVWSHGFLRKDQTAEGQGHPRYCAERGMNSIAKSLAEGLRVRTDTTVTRVEPTGEGWRVRTECGRQVHARTVILSAPLPQSLHLLTEEVREALYRRQPRLAEVAYESCFTVMALLDGPSALPEPGGLHVDDPAVAWIADNTRKLHGTGGSALTIHSTPVFAREHFDAPHAKVQELMLDAAREWIGSDVATCQVHRWRYSKPVRFVGSPCVTLEQPGRLILCGDYMQPPARVEGAVLSGAAAAEIVLDAEQRKEANS